MTFRARIHRTDPQISEVALLLQRIAFTANNIVFLVKSYTRDQQLEKNELRSFIATNSNVHYPVTYSYFN